MNAHLRAVSVHQNLGHSSKILTVLLAFVLVISLSPFGAFAKTEAKESASATTAAQTTGGETTSVATATTAPATTTTAAATSSPQSATVNQQKTAASSTQAATAASSTVTFVVDSTDGAFADTSLAVKSDSNNAKLIENEAFVIQGATLKASQIPEVKAAATGFQFESWTEYAADGVTVKATYSADDLAALSINSDLVLHASFAPVQAATSDAADAAASSEAVASATTLTTQSEDAAVTPQSGDSLTATINYNGTTTALANTGATLDNFSWKGTATLNIDATFGAGTDKTIEISLPVGMSFRTDYAESSAGYYEQFTNLDSKVVKSVVIPPDQTDPAKHNTTLLGVDTMNGTVSIHFYSDGEANNVQHVAFSLPVATIARATWNSGVWESGDFWGYDSIADAVKVTQSTSGAVTNTAKLDKLNFTGDNKSYTNSTSWTSTNNPEVLSGGTTTGDEKWYAAGWTNGLAYSCGAAVKNYTVTFLAPEAAEYAGARTPNYYHQLGTTDPVVTVAGQTTANGYTVPAGYKAYTWTYTDQVLTCSPCFAPQWTFPAASFHDGDQATIKVVDEKLQYYGRADAETIDPAKYPSLTYNIKAPYEECFANVLYQNNERTQNGYESDYTLYMGAPGFEHSQEREAGYFILGNRGLSDSVAKTIEMDYDINNTGIIGVVQQVLPTLSKISNFSYKTWNSETNTVSDWISYTPADTTFNLQDAGIAGGGTTFIKALKFDIDTLPKQQYLKSGNTTDSASYRFNCKVLTNEAVARGLGSKINSTVTISNKDGAASPATVTGRAYDGTSGTSLITGNCDYKTNSGTGGWNRDYNESIAAGSSGTIVHEFHQHDWDTSNAQLIDSIYVISPLGEDYTNITCHYRPNGSIVESTKSYLSSDDTPQPAITEVAASDELKATYPNAKVYKLDFTGITGAQQKYDSRIVGGSVLSSDSVANTPLSTGSKYDGIWLSYDYAPALTDAAATYGDIIWVKYSADTKETITYQNDAFANVYKDTYNLTGSTSAYLGRANGMTITSAQDLVVSSAAKQASETDSSYRTYDGTSSSIVGIQNDVNYKLNIQNYTGQSAQGCSVYWPVPKTGQDWGSSLTPAGAFKYSLDLTHALTDVPAGYKVYYAKNATPTNAYETWDSSNTWVAQDNTTSWTANDWDAVNFVKLVWVGTTETPKIATGTDSTAVFDLHVDTASTTADQMYTLDEWQPYFLRSFSNSSSWVAGKPAATELTPGKLGGTVWEDANANGNIDDGENVIEGAKVELYDVSTGADILRQVLTTGADGKYEFDGLLDGTTENQKYKIVVYNPTDPAAADAYIAFTNKGTDTDMKFAPAADQKSASAEAVAAKDDTGVNMQQDVGLMKAVPVIVPTAVKALSGDTPGNTATFNFDIAGKTGAESLPASTETSVTGAGTASAFGTISYTVPGVYTYYITEKSGQESGYSYDAHVYVWTVAVTHDQASGAWSASADLKVKDSASASDDDAAAAAALQFTNDYTTPTVDKTVAKTWSDSDNAMHVRPASLTVHLLADGTDTGKTLHLNADGNWSGTFSDVPVYTTAGAAIDYTVSEDEVPGYVPTVTDDGTDNAFAIENTLIGGYGEIEKTVTKTWSDSDNALKARPASVTMHLLADGTDTGKTLTLGADNNWKGTFSALAQYSAPGVAVDYTVTEDEVPGYVETITDDGEGSAFAVTNTFTGVYGGKSATIDPPISKVVSGDTPDQASTFAFALTGEGAAPMPKDASGQSVTRSIVGAGSVEMGTMVFDTAGVYVYDVSEVVGSDSHYDYDSANYKMTVTVTADANGDLQATKAITKNGTAADAVEFNNVYTASASVATDAGTALYDSATPLGLPKTGDSVPYVPIAVLAVVGVVALAASGRRVFRKR